MTQKPKLFVSTIRTTFIHIIFSFEVILVVPLCKPKSVVNRGSVFTDFSATNLKDRFLCRGSVFLDFSAANLKERGSPPCARRCHTIAPPISLSWLARAPDAAELSWHRFSPFFRFDTFASQDRNSDNEPNLTVNTCPPVFW